MNRKKSSFAFATMCCAVSILTAIMTIGCGEDTEDALTMNTEHASTLAEMKVVDTAPGAPQMQLPKGTPTVTSVGYYSDWKLTKPLTGTVSTGKTIFIKVEFSEGMKLVVADDKTARPILYHRIGGKLTRFHIAKFGAKGNTFTSGDAKPVKTQAAFIGKYTVQPKDRGTFVFAVGKFSVDKEGNTLPAFYTHNETLQLGATSPSMTSVGYYADWQAKKPLTGTVKSGTTVYTKIVFSEEMEQVVSDGDKSRPELYYRIGNRDIRHNIVPMNARGRHYAPGDTKPVKNHATYLGKYQVKASDYGDFTLVVDTRSTSKQGNTLPEKYVHTESLHILAPPAPTVTIIGAPSGVDNTDSMLATIGGRGVTHYKYSVATGKECGEYSEPVSIYQHLEVDVSDLPDGTATLCVLGKNIANIWQTKPTTAQWTRDSTVVPIAPEPVIAKPAEDTRGTITALPPSKTPAVTIPRGANAAEAARKAELVMLWVEHKRKLLEGSQGSFWNRWFGEVLTPIGVSKNLRKEIFIIQFDGPTGIPARATGNERWFPETIREYLSLQLLHPTQGEKEILELFRQSVQSGKVVITRKFRLPKTTELQEVERFLPL